MSGTRIFISTAIAILLTSSFTLSQNLIGPLSGRLGPGVLYVVGNIWVDSGDTLIIAAGSELRVNGDFDFDIYGTVLAAGTVSDSISFIHNYGYSNWNGLDFHGPETDGCLFQYCLFEGSNCKGLDFDGSSPRFEHCSIVNNNAGGG